MNRTKHMKSFLWCIFGLLVLLFVFSCDYETEKENISGLEAPTENPDITINLSLDQDTVIFYDPGIITYDLSTFGYDIYTEESYFEIGNDKYGYTQFPIDSSYGEIPVDLGTNSYVIKNLELFLCTQAQTGSAASVLGEESYVYRQNWTLILDSRLAPNVYIRSRINQDSLLEYYWERCDDPNFEYYMLYYKSNGASHEIKINDQDSTYVVDSLYCTGDYYYKAGVKIKPREMLSSAYYSSSKSSEEKQPDLEYEFVGLDSVRLFWDRHKLRSKYSLLVDEEQSPIYYSDMSSVVISYPIFTPGTKYCLMKCTPYYDSLFTELNYRYLSSSLRCEHFYNREYSNGLSSFHYDYYSNGLLIRRQSSTNNYGYQYECDYFTGAEISSEKLKSITLDFNYKLDFQPNSPGFVTFSILEENDKLDSCFMFYDDVNQSHTEVVYFDDIDLEVSDEFYFWEFDYMSNGSLALAHNESYMWFDPTTNSLDTLFAIDNYMSYRADEIPRTHIMTSSDGSYCSLAGSDGITIYSIENKKATVHYTDNRNYNSIYVDPREPDVIWMSLTDESKIEARNIADFSLISEMETPVVLTLENIDPFTDYLLSADRREDFKECYIIDVKREKTLLKAKYNTDYQIKLINSTLLSRVGGWLDISKELKDAR